MPYEVEDACRSYEAEATQRGEEEIGVRSSSGRRTVYWTIASLLYHFSRTLVEKIHYLPPPPPSAPLPPPPPPSPPKSSGGGRSALPPPGGNNLLRRAIAWVGFV